MADEEIEIKGYRYRLSRLDVRSQFHIVRKLGTVVTELINAIGVMGKMDPSDVNQLQALAPVLTTLAGLEDDDCNYVLDRCLSVVRRQQPSGNLWAPIQSSSSGLMFDDIGLLEMMQLASLVIRINLTPFFSGLLDGSFLAAQPTPPSGPAFQTEKTGC